MVDSNLVSPDSLTLVQPLWVAPSFHAATTDTGAATVEIITDPAKFIAMEAEWNDTVDRASIYHPFLRHEWMRTWWESFAAGRRLHIIVVRCDAQIVAIAPMMWETASMYGVQVRRLRLLQNDHTPDADFIIAGNPDECYRAIWQAMVNSPERWDVLLLSEVPHESPTLIALRALADEQRFAMGVWASDESPYLSLNRTYDEYMASLSREFRQNLRNRWTRLTKLGTPAFEVLDGWAAIKESCPDALHLEASGWKQSAGTSIESDRATHSFYTKLADRAAAAGWLRLFYLTLDGRRIATAYAAEYDGRLMFIKTGYDPEFAKCSPFKTLTHLAIRHAFESGLHEVDFLGTAEAWKLEWTKTTRNHDWLFIFGNTVRGRLLHQVKFRIKPALARYLHR